MNFPRIRSLAIALSLTGLAVSAETPRSELHEKYTQQLWSFLTQSGNGYENWTRTRQPISFEFGPKAGPDDITFLNTYAAGSSTPDRMPQKSTVVTKHVDGHGDTVGLTVYYKGGQGYDPRHQDWYWVHYVPTGTAIKTSIDTGSMDKPGFLTVNEDGRLWVFRLKSKQVCDFFAKGEPAKCVVRPGAGPGGMTLKGAEADTLLEFVATKPGFTVKTADGRLWVFRSGSEQLSEFEEQGELAKHVIRPGAGPMGVTLKAPDAETIDDYLLRRKGFVTKVIDGRVWVFREDADELADFEADGELAKHVIRPGAGPGGMTVKAPDTETILEFTASRDGFHVVSQDGRLWVFREGSEAMKDFQEKGELAKHVIRPGAGPDGVTLKAPDTETLDAFMRSMQRG
jgi:sugar lactone lactonase YvrE